VASLCASLDGQWVAFTSGPPQEDIYVARLDGSGLRQLTNDQPFDRVPRWSPDGRRIAFYSSRGGVQQAWSIKPDGSDLRQLTDHPGTGILGPVWSPDGSRMAGGVQILNKVLLFDPQKRWSDQQPEELPSLEGSQGAIIPRSWSPDGAKLLCDYRFGNAVIVYSFQSRQFDQLVEGVKTTSGLPSWLADSRRFLFTRGNGDLMLLDTSTKKSRVVLPAQPDTITGRAFRDNRQIVFSRATTEGDIYMLTFK
jgi:Tol biopolymer transport system component